MKNIYQAVLDAASEKRNQKYEPSPQLSARVKEYLRERETSRVFDEAAKRRGAGNGVS